jgi:hypothetical protein
MTPRMKDGLILHGLVEKSMRDTFKEFESVPSKDENEERWLLLINQLESVGAKVSRHEENISFYKQEKVSLLPTNFEIYFIFGNPIYHILYSSSGFKQSKFSESFDSLPDKYKDIFIFYLDLMENEKF